MPRKKNPVAVGEGRCLPCGGAALVFIDKAGRYYTRCKEPACLKCDQRNTDDVQGAMLAGVLAVSGEPAKRPKSYRLPAEPAEPQAAPAVAPVGTVPEAGACTDPEPGTQKPGEPQAAPAVEPVQEAAAGAVSATEKPAEPQAPPAVEPVQGAEKKKGRGGLLVLALLLATGGTALIFA